MNVCTSSATQLSDYNNSYVLKMVDFLERADELAKNACRDGSLWPEQQGILEKAKDAISHFNAMVEEVTKHF